MKRLLGVVVILGFGIGGFGIGLQAQPPDQPPGPPSPPQQAPQPLLSPDQLDDLVAPIALYPDPLLSQVLVACTYPLEVVEAQQWLQQNRSLSGTQLMDAARQQNWDPSVQALVAFPDVLARLNQDVRWSNDLGNAFLAQQADVMSAVQRMRARAQADGKLSSNPQQTVTTDVQDGQSAIQIEPANPQVVYVPSYDPMYIWGPPAWGWYPSLYYPAFGWGFGPGIDIGLCFGGWGGWGGWGWGPNWFGRSVFVNTAFFGRYGFRGGLYRGGDGRGFGGRVGWSHDPGHRLGVPYPNRQLAGRFQAASLASRSNMSRQGFGARSGFQGSRYQSGQFQSGRQIQGNRQVQGGRQFQGGQGYRGAAPQSTPRSYQSLGGVQGRQSYQSAPRSHAPAPNRSMAPSPNFSGGARSFNGGGAGRSVAPAPSFNGGARSFNGGGARSVAPSFNGGGGARSVAPSFNGGGGARSVAPSFNGGGGARSVAPSFNGGGGARSVAPSFNGGGGARSVAPAPHFSGGGGGARSFSGGGGGGGSHGGGGGSHDGGGGGHGRR